MYFMKHFTLWFITVLQLITFIGCTTTKHEPECTCDCKENNSHFECGGIHSHEEVKIK